MTTSVPQVLLNTPKDYKLQAHSKSPRNLRNNVFFERPPTADSSSSQKLIAIVEVPHFRAVDHLARIIHDAQSVRGTLLAGWKPSDPKMLAVLRSQTGWKEKINWSHEELGDMIDQLADHNQDRDQAAAEVVDWRPVNAESVDRLERLRKRFRSKSNGPFTCEELAFLIGRLTDDMDKKKKAGLILTEEGKALHDF